MRKAKLMDVFRKNILYIFPFLLIFLITSCSTVGSLKKENSKQGKVEVYDLPYKNAYDFAIHACEDLDFRIKSQNFEKRYIVAKSIYTFSEGWGVLMGIHFREIDADHTEVHVVSKPALHVRPKVNVNAAVYEKRFLTALKRVRDSHIAK
jgi:hypothetical protein